MTGNETHPSRKDYQGPYDPTTATSMKIDFASFYFFRDYSTGTSYLKEGNLGLELKGRDRVRVLTEMVAFIALPGGYFTTFWVWIWIYGMERWNP